MEPLDENDVVLGDTVGGMEVSESSSLGRSQVSGYFKCAAPQRERD